MEHYGIRKTHETLKRRLINYIEAQYFAENNLLLDGTKELLQRRKVLFQEPFIEATPTYKLSSDGFDSADLPENIKSYMRELIAADLGVFKTPFVHQIKSMETFFQGKDLLVTTGTGSGKTECFMWPMLSQIMNEVHKSPETWEKEGIRALVLYPMNALVSDQLGRLRCILGRADDGFMKILCKLSSPDVRRPRFGMYTGRTPYPGEGDINKDKVLANVLSQNYIDCDPKYKRQLMEIGRIPAKVNLEGYVANLYKGLHYTAPDDSELYTRQEMHNICPDIFITNYSMLEYTLMRPIESTFWSKTKSWLDLSPDNKLVLVIDEAHMYRGAPGGEVSLLIRRLLNKLDINRNKLQCILTSASVPKGNDGEIRKFACGLTGLDIGKDNFVLIRGENEELKGAAPGDRLDASKLAKVDYTLLQGTPEERKAQLEILAKTFGWENPSDNYEDWLYDHLSMYPPMKLILQECRGKALSFEELASKVFAGVETSTAERATETLLALGPLARKNAHKHDELILLPSRVHMLFKGLNGIFACINPNCPHGHKAKGIEIGNIEEDITLKCEYCGARVFELVRDRRCGTVFIRAFSDVKDTENFMWQEQSKIIAEPVEIHLWIVPNGRKSIFEKKLREKRSTYTYGYIDSKTGKLFYDDQHEGEPGFVRVLIPLEKDKETGIFTFKECPNCGKTKLGLQQFVTRGNEPFSNLIIQQLWTHLFKTKA